MLMTYNVNVILKFKFVLCQDQGIFFLQKCSVSALILTIYTSQRQGEM